MTFGEIHSSAPASLYCPACGETIRLVIPIAVTVDTAADDSQTISARVRDEISWESPAWKHALSCYGPEDPDPEAIGED